MNIDFFLPTFKLFPYEQELLRRELISLLNNEAYIDNNKNIISICNDNARKNIDIIINRSTYVDKLIVCDKEYKTLQSLAESTNSLGRKRQATRYLIHGIHDYRGKFNPQIARSILNILNISPGMSLFDPFCGSGTTLLEASRLGIEAFGCDINPFAVFISTAKLDALRLEPTELRNNLYAAIAYAKSKKNCPKNEFERSQYLLSWIPANTLTFLERYKEFCEHLEYKEVYLAIASNLIRSYSNQEPSDLRIRRRISPFPTIPIEESLLSSGLALEQNLRLFSASESFLNFSTAHVEVHDIRNFSTPGKSFDVALTSPPYATALPYIDTHRISMVWLNLIEASEIYSLEEHLVGSREIAKAEQVKIIESMDSYRNFLPASEITFCSSLIKALNKNDGFRRQAVPALIMRYFYDMHCTFQSIMRVMKSRSPFALIVGTNKTTLGGKKIEIDTPSHIVSIGKHVGWRLREVIPLQTYQRYGLHSKNGINSESLILMESP
jgi:site-specific DNA-methyltransferase (cytosine-N4-specific)